MVNTARYNVYISIKVLGIKISRIARLRMTLVRKIHKCGKFYGTIYFPEQRNFKRKKRRWEERNYTLKKT